MSDLKIAATQYLPVTSKVKPAEKASNFDNQVILTDKNGLADPEALKADLKGALESSKDKILLQLDPNSPELYEIDLTRPSVKAFLTNKLKDGIVSPSDLKHLGELLQKYDRTLDKNNHFDGVIQINKGYTSQHDIEGAIHSGKGTISLDVEGTQVDLDLTNQKVMDFLRDKADPKNATQMGGIVRQCQFTEHDLATLKALQAPVAKVADKSAQADDGGQSHGKASVSGGAAKGPVKMASKATPNPSKPLIIGPNNTDPTLGPTLKIGGTDKPHHLQNTQNQAVYHFENGLTALRGKEVFMPDGKILKPAAEIERHIHSYTLLNVKDGQQLSAEKKCYLAAQAMMGMGIDLNSKDAKDFLGQLMIANYKSVGGGNTYGGIQSMHLNKEQLIINLSGGLNYKPTTLTAKAPEAFTGIDDNRRRSTIQQFKTESTHSYSYNWNVFTTSHDLSKAHGKDIQDAFKLSPEYAKVKHLPTSSDAYAEAYSKYTLGVSQDYISLGLAKEPATGVNLAKPLNSKVTTNGIQAMKPVTTPRQAVDDFIRDNPNATPQQIGAKAIESLFAFRKDWETGTFGTAHDAVGNTAFKNALTPEDEALLEKLMEQSGYKFDITNQEQIKKDLDAGQPINPSCFNVSKK